MAFSYEKGGYRDDGEHTFPCWPQSPILPMGSQLIGPTVSSQEHQSSFTCHRGCSENDLAQQEPRTVLEPYHQGQLSRPTPTLSHRNRKGSHIIYSLHIKQGNIKGKNVLRPKAMLFASHTAAPCFIVLLRYCAFLQIEGCGNPPCVVR